MNYILLHDLQRSRKLMGIKKIVNYVGIILFTVLWTTTEQIMDLPLIQKKKKI